MVEKMGLVHYIGRRIELVSMDKHFRDISIGLYQQHGESGPEVLLKTYSRITGAKERVHSVSKTMKTLGGMEMMAEERLRYTCLNSHTAATRRLFLEACKVSPTENITTRALSVFDKKLGDDLEVLSVGEGCYQVDSTHVSQESLSRCAVVAAGLVKLAELEWIDEKNRKIMFKCGHSHDELIGLLLPRALNTRSFLRQQKMDAGRGQLLAPSAQQ